jgi:hypothetical protein
LTSAVVAFGDETHKSERRATFFSYNWLPLFGFTSCSGDDTREAFTLAQLFKEADRYQN